MQEVLNMLYQVWVNYFNFIRSWKVIGNISLFDILIAVLVIGTLIPILFNVIGSSTWLTNEGIIHRREQIIQERENRRKDK